MLRLIRRSLGTLLVLPTALAAQWAEQPSGNWSYTAPSSTSGVFACGAPAYLTGATCSASGNEIVFDYGGGSTTTMRFTGRTGPVSALRNVQSPFTLGDVELAYAGPRTPTLPSTSHPWATPAHLAITLLVEGTPGIVTSNRIDLVAFTYPKGSIIGSSMRFQYYYDFASYSVPIPDWPISHSPQGFWFGYPTSEPMTATAGHYAIGVMATVAPEPGTWALMATGLLGIAGAARRRRAQS